MGPTDLTPYLSLVKSVAARMVARLPKTVDLDDLIGAGVLGLLNAARQYDESRGVPFDRYAEIRVRGAIVDELRNMDQTPRSARRRLAEFEEIARTLASHLGRMPSSEEMASALGLSVGRYEEMLRDSRPMTVVGFDDLGYVADDGRREGGGNIEDVSCEHPEEAVASREVLEKVFWALEKLTPRQRQVILFYYYEGMSFREIAQVMEITEGRVSQLHTAATERLKTLLEDHSTFIERRKGHE